MGESANYEEIGGIPARKLVGSTQMHLRAYGVALYGHLQLSAPEVAHLAGKLKAQCLLHAKGLRLTTGSIPSYIVPVYLLFALAALRAGFCPLKCRFGNLSVGLGLKSWCILVHWKSSGDTAQQNKLPLQKKALELLHLSMTKHVDM